MNSEPSITPRVTAPSLNTDPVERNVLIIEDSIAASMIMSAKIERDQPWFNVHVVTRMDDALEKLKTFKPDVVVLDANLPDSLAFDTLNKIPDFLATGAKVLVVTADMLLEGASKVKGADFLAKPFAKGSTDFLDRIRKLAL